MLERYSVELRFEHRLPHYGNLYVQKIVLLQPGRPVWQSYVTGGKPLHVGHGTDTLAGYAVPGRQRFAVVVR